MPAESQSELTTPCLVVDLERMGANIAEAALACARGGKLLRPHVKTHKCPEIGRMQLQAGAVGITVQTVMEAEVFAGQGFADVFLARPPVQPAEADRLARLAEGATVRVAADSPQGLEVLGRAARRAGTRLLVRLEVDIGAGRSGVVHEEALLELSTELERQPGLEPDGLFGYEGQVYLSESEADLARRAGEALERLQGMAAALHLSAGEVGLSMGSTLSYRLLAGADGRLELRPGNYVFADARAMPLLGLERCALSVLATVISRPTSERCVLDCGSKAIPAELYPEGWLRRTSFGHVVEYPEARIVALSEEHGVVDLTACPRRPQVGERVQVIPNHACTAVNLHRRLHGLRDGRVERVWEVEPRGYWA